MADRKTDFDIIADSLARGKALIKESLELSRKNIERKKNIEKRLMNCYAEEKSFVNNDSCFTFDIDSNQISLIPKEKYSDICSESITQLYKKDENFNEKEDMLIKERNYAQQKLEEIQDFVRELEGQNFELKNKIKMLVRQIQNTVENESMASSFEHKVKLLQQDNNKLIIENRNLNELTQALKTENWNLNELTQALKTENQILKNRLNEISESQIPTIINKKQSPERIVKIHHNEETDNSILKYDASTESYIQYFKNLKKQAFLNKKYPLCYLETNITPNPQIAHNEKEYQPIRSASSKENYKLRNDITPENINEKSYLKDSSGKCQTPLYDNKKTDSRKLSISFDNGLGQNKTKKNFVKQKTPLKIKNNGRSQSRHKKPIKSKL
ncbi:hypothetical protein SteCoe_12867 [Stentor coeruleus]|uniref:Uncharacterized protein n=1 Tax=Stentor coeruleus TaxID=5963 RepID=A0A1R2C9U3_9CILI|nr:hypothetical protein SteCoe_12867 [Stentor coeruleus]